MVFEEIITYNVIMIDLHLHLDGSLSIEDFKYLSKKDGISLGEDFPKNIYVSKDCKSLEEYLERFDLPLKFMQSKENIEYLTASLVKRLYKLGYIYVEIRYAPLLHLNKGLTMDEVVKASIDGLNKGLKECPGFDANLILCCMRHADEKLNMETVEMAYKYRNQKVCAVDLAGAEALHPSSYYSRVFSKAKEYGLNITIHAGEATGSDEIMMAIDNGAIRIGHGVHLSLDKDSIKKVKDHNVCFEFCPTSNLQTKSLKDYNHVPLRDFMNNQIPVCINADNMTVSDVSAISEMKQMIKTFSLTKEEVFRLYMNAIEHAFIENSEKSLLKKKLESVFEKYWSNLSNEE